MCTIFAVRTKGNVNTPGCRGRKNVKIRPNEFVMPARTVFDLGSSETYQDVNDPSVAIWGDTLINVLA